MNSASLAPDVVRLVIAARIVAFEDKGEEAIKELDEASEAFADRVPWDDEPFEDAALSTPNAPVEPAGLRSLRHLLAHMPDKDLHLRRFDAQQLLQFIDAILAVRLDEAVIRKDEREKCLNQVCESLFVIADGWKEQPGKEETATAVSNAAVFICGKERAIAIRNGGKQP